MNYRHRGPSAKDELIGWLTLALLIALALVCWCLVALLAYGAYKLAQLIGPIPVIAFGVGCAGVAWLR